MRNKQTLEQRMWRWSLLIHETLFTLFWALVFYELAFTPPYGNDRTLPLLLVLWMPFMFIHIAAYFTYARRPDTVEIERKAYREGFADGVREKVHPRDGYDSRHLSTDYPVEYLSETPELEKRKREMR